MRKVNYAIFIILFLLVLTMGKDQFFQSGFAQDTRTQALILAKKGQWQAAIAKAKASKDKTTELLVQWFYYYKNNQINASYEDSLLFFEETKEWPYQRAARLLVEERLSPSVSNKDIIDWFEQYKPVSASGSILYAQALMAIQPSQGLKYIQEYWQTTDLLREEQKRFYQSFKDKLRPIDHEKRIDYLIWREEYQQAQALMPFASPLQQKIAKARIALAQNKGHVDLLIKKIPSNALQNPGLIYERVRWRRAKGLTEGAIALLNLQPKSPPFAEKWWQERHIIIRRLLEDKDYQKAYELTSRHKQTEGFAMAQAEWLAGWLAVNFLNKPLIGFQHFYTLYTNVKTPISKSRGAYWAGVASVKAGNKDIAKQWFAAAARYATTFYGQLAALELYKLDPQYPVYLMPKVQPASLVARMSFERKSLVEAIHLLAENNFEEEKRLFIHSLIENLEAAPDFSLAASLAKTYNDSYSQLKIAKKAFQKGYLMLKEGYPVLPHSYDILAQKEVVHAIIRQESVFDSRALSPAGARGLMQLMPATAKQLAKQKGKSYARHYLTERPQYNVSLGASYIQQLLKKYDGSYPLAIAAYNAGQGRIDTFLKVFGDPRKGEISIIDWIELIPIYETRNYVQRVMEAVLVYYHQINNENPNRPAIYAGYWEHITGYEKQW